MPNSNLPSDIRSAVTPKDFSLWHGKKEVIKNLYIHHKRTLGDVKTTMEREHGFPTTLKLSDYEHALREVLKYRKNLSSDEWLTIGPEIAKRKVAGKRSAVFLDGSSVDNVDRKIQRSRESKRSRRCAKAHIAALPDGVVIKTPPGSPQFSALASSLPSGRDSEAYDLEQYASGLSSMEFLADYKAELDWLGSLMDVIPLPRAGPGVEVLSAQLLRLDCPINEFLTILNEYQRKFNLAGLRLFGPNVTLGVLGKICFDFSNGLSCQTISWDEQKSILNWIGFKADITSLETFFAQKSLTVLAAWEVLSSTVLNWNHLAALDVLLSVHLSIKDQAPWKIGSPFHGIQHYIKMVPNRFVELINAYPCDQSELDQALGFAMSNKSSIGLVKQLISTGASPKSQHCRSKLDRLIRYFGSQECQEVDLALLKIFLEAGAVVDQPRVRKSRLGWKYPDDPRYATDYLLLLEEHSTRNHTLWSLICSYSSRQQTTVTVPGIFEAAQGGQEQLRSYLNSRAKPEDDHDRKQVLEFALSEASARGYADVLQSLVRFGVDPNVRMLPKAQCPCHESQCIIGRQNTWHPVIRAANNGRVDTLRILVTVCGMDIALLSKQVGSLEELDLCALRIMRDSQRTQILRLLSTLNVATATRNEILLNALVRHNTCTRHFHYPYFDFVNQLLELGLASLDHRVYSDGEFLLARAIRRGCDISALTYLVEQDMWILSAPPLRVLWEATLTRDNYNERHAILRFFAQKVEGFESYAQENSSTLLSTFLQDSRCSRGFQNTYCEHGEEDCEIVVIVRWFLDLGATLEISGFAQLTRHANESFMLALIDSVTDLKVVDKSSALYWAINYRWVNLAVALIERGVQINGAQECGAQTILQHACGKGTPLWFIKFLLDKGADVNAPPAKNNGLTALQYAVERGSMNMVGLLLDYGADVNALGPGWHLQKGLTLHLSRAIDVAVLYSKLDMVHFLVAAGGRSGHPGLTGFDGAITIANWDRHCAVAALLRKHAESHRKDRMEAERKWLEENPAARMDMERNKAEFELFMKSEDGQRIAQFRTQVEELD